MIPFLELSNLLAQNGLSISYISTPRNFNRLPQIPPHLSHLINFIPIPLPTGDGHLPDGAESTSDLPQHLVPYLKLAYDDLEPELTQFLETKRPDWVIYDFAPHWLPPIAAKLGVSTFYFSIVWAATWCFFVPSSSTDAEVSRMNPEDFTVPPKWIPFSSNLAYRLHEAKRLLEPMKLDLARQLYGKKLFIPIGLLPPYLDPGLVGNDETWLTISEWLNNREKATVVYVAFGSEVALTKDEITELALGLESLEIPFVWVLKQHFHELLPEGFISRIGSTGSGMICSAWVPQVKILGHESVGGFVTQCGWSSVIECYISGSFDHAAATFVESGADREGVCGEGGRR
ncbi:UDP-glycosyltransferase 91C1 [Linum grandiflorum]